MDKSFLQSVPKHKFEELRRNYTFVLSIPLLAECLDHFSINSDSTDDVKRRNLNGIGKFSTEENSLPLADETGSLLTLEAEIRRPYYPIQDYEKGVGWFNVAILTKQGLDIEQSNAVEQWRNRCNNLMESQIQILRNRQSLLFKWSDRLKALIQQSNENKQELRRAVRKEIPKYEQLISSDVEFVRSQYRNSLRPYQYPPAEILDPRWVLFRYCQAQLLFHLRLMMKEGYEVGDIDATEKERKRMQHDLIDAEYCILAALYGSFATADGPARDLFKLLCPDGIVLFWNQNECRVEFQ